PRTAGVHEGLAVEGRPAAERLLAAQHVRRVHGGRSRDQAARRDRRRQHAVGERLPARRVDLAKIPGVPAAHLRRDAERDRTADHRGERRAYVRLSGLSTWGAPRWPPISYLS